ncbi:MAG: PfaD family polyunsaturated fatty acid/polyketide biosynthesis protein [Myxococcales bacterium]|nr:PfaD family polyunsaturated fatty acid/polyketide biosynthesis protein [Myxococcales bacterium]
MDLRPYLDGSVAPRRRSLAEALDGAAPGDLASLVWDSSEVVLRDGELSVVVTRTDASTLRVTTSWGAEQIQQIVPIPSRPLLRSELDGALADISRPLHRREGRWFDGLPLPHGRGQADRIVPAVAPEELGDPGFRAAHGVQRAYIAGAMAGGIASPELVIAMGKAGYIGFYGSGGLDLGVIEQAVVRIKGELGAQPCGFNLLHNPSEPAVEEGTVDLYLKHGVRTISASAFMGLTPAVVRFRLAGLHEQDGEIVAPNKVLAKVSRTEVAEPFLRPAPPKLLAELVASKAITPRQAQLAAHIPIAEDVTPEADSGGHTDGRPLSVLVPVFRRLRDRVQAELNYAVVPRIGAAGGIADPESLAAALTLGAGYVLTGSVNQCTREAGTSPLVKEMLAQAGYADVANGPAPDMFEIGAKVQVLSRGSLYAQRSQLLYDVYREHASWDDVPKVQRDKIEKQILGRPFEAVWSDTERYWTDRDAREAKRAQEDGHHRMALCFRWYLGMTSRWARTGDITRKRDYQIWCGPAMGLFNDWARGTPLEAWESRTVVGIADALMTGACVVLRQRMALG